MTYRIDLTPEKQERIEAAAARLGVAVETFITQAAESQAEKGVTEHNALFDALALLDTLAPTLCEGMATGAPVDAAAELDMLRAQRFGDAHH